MKWWVFADEPWGRASDESLKPFFLHFTISKYIEDDMVYKVTMETDNWTRIVIDKSARWGYFIINEGYEQYEIKC